MMRRTTRLLVLLTALAVLMAACGNSGDDDPETGGATTTEAGEPDDGGDDPAGDERDTFVSISGVPGVSDDEITFAAIGTKSNNPLGTCILDCYVAGIQAYFDWRNDEGGIYGRDLVLGEVLDDELAQNQVRTIDVISKGEAFGVFDATLVASGFGDLDSAGVPSFVWNIHGTEFANRPSLFGNAGAICSDCIQRTFPYFVKEAGATKVATLGYGVSENSKVCTQSLRRSIETFSDDIGGAEVAYLNDELAFGVPNGVGPEVSAMKEAGVEFIGTCMDLNGMKTLAQELERQGMGDVIMSHPNTYNQSFVRDAGGIFEGDIVSVGFMPFEADTDNELQAKFIEYMEKQGQEPSELAIVGFINADTAFTGLLEAGPEFDRQKVIDALNSLTEYTAGGLIPPIDWTTAHTPPTPDDPQPQTCSAPVRVVDGEFEPYADPKKPFICFDNSSPGWSEPENVAFAGR
jgi:hypothetical protein